VGVLEQRTVSRRINQINNKSVQRGVSVKGTACDGGDDKRKMRDTGARSLFLSSEKGE